MNILSNLYLNRLFTQSLKIIFFSIICMIGVSFVCSVYAATKIVNCTNNPTDRALIQSAIDNAGSGDIVKLVGICQLDGTMINITKSNLTLEGAGASGNWSTVVRGLTDSSGSPLEDGPAPIFNYYNRAFRIGPSNNVIANVTIRNIKFQSLKWAIDIIPQVSSSNNRCDTYASSKGSGANIIVSNNLFDNNWGSVEVLGASNNVQINDNLVTNAVHYDFVIWGLSPPHYCNEVVPVPRLITLGAPNNVKVIGNTNQNDQWFISLDVINSDYVLVANNKLTNASGGEVIFMSGVTNTLVINNVFDGGGQSTGFYISDNRFPNAPSPASSNVKIINNQVNNSYPAIAINSSTTGYSLIANKYNGTVRGLFGGGDYGDVLICDDGSANTIGLCDGTGGKSSFNNVVVGAPCTRIMDLGINNKSVGLVSVSNNVTIPPADQCKSDDYSDDYR